jgi:O-antigen ligase
LAHESIGFRPVAFFEHGNQYGIWAAAAALVGVWLWCSTPPSRVRRILAAVAGLGVAISVVSQSVGAILLLCAGLVLYWAIGRPLPRGLLVSSFVLALFAGGTYLSGAVPLRELAENTAFGRQVVNVIRSSGRASFNWRIARDQTALRLISEHPIIGTARWDWWRENGERPWGLLLLIVGQFGVIGCLLAFGSLLIPGTRALAIKRYHSEWRYQPTQPLAAIVLMTIADALFKCWWACGTERQWRGREEARFTQNKKFR